MDEKRAALIADAFAEMIRRAEDELVAAEIAHRSALACEVDADDPEDVSFVEQDRADTGAEAYAARRVADALIEAEAIALRDEPVRAGASVTAAMAAELWPTDAM